MIRAGSTSQWPPGVPRDITNGCVFQGLWCHWLDQSDYDAVADQTRY